MTKNGLALESLWLAAWLLSGTLSAAADSPRPAKLPGKLVHSDVADNGPRSAGSTPIAADSPGVKLARGYLAELLPVLAHLRSHEPEQYRKAIRDLDRAAKRLQSLQRRDAALHAVALREWQTRGRIDLLKARLRVRRSDADTQQLLVHQRQLREIEIERLQRERELLAERATLMSQRTAQAQQVAERSRRQIEQLEQQIERLQAQRVAADSAASQRAGRPAAAPDHPAAALDHPGASATENQPRQPSVTTKKSRASQ